MAKVTLSFDNGPDPKVTPKVLEILARHDVLASFFVIGVKAATPQGYALAERAKACGHWIGNHTYTHETPLGLDDDPSAPEREIGATQRVMGALSETERLFRPFGGGGHLDARVLSPAALQYVQDNGYTCVTWNCVPGDWKDADGWPARALAEIAAQDWSLVVLHDIPGACVDRLDGFIASLRKQGHEIAQDFPPGCVPIENGKVIRPEGMAWLGEQRGKA